MIVLKNAMTTMSTFYVSQGRNFITYLFVKKKPVYDSSLVQIFLVTVSSITVAKTTRINVVTIYFVIKTKTNWGQLTVESYYQML